MCYRSKREANVNVVFESHANMLIYNTVFHRCVVREEVLLSGR